MSWTRRLILNNLKDISGIDITFSRNCNMRCSYCYISKHSPDSLQKDNLKIQQALINGDFYSNIIKYFDDDESKQQIQLLSLWGAEPTLNADMFEGFIFQLLDYFPNVYSVMFSTNSLLGFPALNKFISAINKYSQKYDRKLTLQLQFSLDGPAYINDVSRYKGACANTIKTISEIIEYYNHNDLYCTVKIFPKPTLTCDTFGFLGKNKDKLIEWYTFFSDLDSQFAQKNHNKNILITFITLPTLVNPGYHTNEDGKNFACFLRTLNTITQEEIPFSKDFTLFQAGFLDYWTSEKMRYLQAPLTWSSSHCSAGKNLISIDYQGNISLCHRAQDSTYDGNPDYFKWEKNITAYGKTELSRMTYIGTMLHASHEAQCHIIKMVLTGMVLAGEIDRKYLDSPQYLKWLCFFHLGTCCWVGQTIDSGSMHVPTQSYIRLFCNGALEELLKYYYKEKDSFDYEHLFKRK